ncbi:hypothetical protein GCM10009737_36450 [Nocardioides lentus]|uniref:Neutral metalloproteinase n=1 Tax=Nocardioides lentus TaxID=338077 RepID=A0ABP5B6K0_9ACTN
MRRALITATALAAVLATAAPASADPSDPSGTTDPGTGATGGAPAAPALPDLPETPEEALDVAVDALAGQPGDAEPEEVEASLALRDLWLLSDGLEGRDADRADSLLARPSDRRRDQYGDGYAAGTPVVRRCAEDVCVHHVATTEDAASPAYAERALAVMQDVHAHHVDELGWRPPVSDGERGGDGRFDVYLANLGDQGLYGYCSPDDGTARGQRVTDGYCVLDNDFAEPVFSANSPDDNLRVTAAHEYLHAIQYAYDAREDTWLFEATATWMEEQYADDVDDNRQYLGAGQLRRPDQPLDRSVPGSRALYGNWIFFEHLANRFDPAIVREVWEAAAPSGPAASTPAATSVPAVATALAGRGTTLRRAFAAYAGDNTVPARSSAYPEGAAWGRRAPVARTVDLDRDRRSSGAVVQRVDHLASRTVALTSRGFADGVRLRVRVDGPPGAASPAVQVVVHRRSGSVGRRFVPLNGPSGARTVSLDFASARVSEVTLTLVNASRRYRCFTGSTFSCQGTPRDDGSAFTLTATAVR